jgi:hypothetical protein
MGEPYTEPYEGQECWEARPRPPYGIETPAGTYRAVSVPCRLGAAYQQRRREWQARVWPKLAERLRQMAEAKEGRKNG